MEFKGSQEEWKKVFKTDGTRAIRTKGGYIISFWKPSKYDGQDERYERELNETKANQILVQKSPEMLKALKDVIEELEDIDVLENMRNYLIRLVKEATTI